MSGDIISFQNLSLDIENRNEPVDVLMCPGKLISDDQLLSSPVATVLNILLKHWKARSERDTKPGEDVKEEIAYVTQFLVPRIDTFIETTLANDVRLLQILRMRRMRTRRRAVNQHDFTLPDIVSAFREALRLDDLPGIFTGNMSDKQHYSQMSVVTLLGMDRPDAPPSPNTFVNTNMDAGWAAASSSARRHTHEPGADDANDIDNNPYWVVSLARSLLAHCVTYEHHVKPHLDKLRHYCDLLQAKECKPTQLVSIYARHISAIHAVLEVHVDAARQIGQDIVRFLKPEHGLTTSAGELHDMSHVLRDQIPSLRMPNDTHAEGAQTLRENFPHLLSLYQTVHGTLCHAAFQNAIPKENDLIIPPSMFHLLDILGGDRDLAAKLGNSVAAIAIRNWASRIRREYNQSSPDFKDVEILGQIVSVLREACDVLGYQMASYKGILGRLERGLIDHIDIEIPRLAKEQVMKLRPEEYFRQCDFTLDVASALLRSPSPQIQIHGIRAMVHYVEPFAKRHFKMHTDKEKTVKEEQTELQKARLGDAFEQCLRPYDRPDDVSQCGKDKNLSLSHLGPLPPYKGHMVQDQLDRSAVHAGSIGRMYPLVVLVGPSGVGKSDLLEQLSKFHIRANGSLDINYAELLLPLNFNREVNRSRNTTNMRRDLEREVLAHVLAQMIITIALLRDSEDSQSLPPTPHDLFRYFNNGGCSFVMHFRNNLEQDHVTLSTVLQCRTELLKTLESAASHRVASGKFRTQLSFAIDEVNALAELHKGKVKKSSDDGSGSLPTGSMLTIVAHILQMIGTSVYAGTGLRYGLFEETISALGKEIIVMAPSFPPTTFRTVAYVLHRLLRFEKLNQGCETTAVQSIELPMLCGRMRFLELFMLELFKQNPEDTSFLSDDEYPDRTFCNALVSVGNLMTHVVKHSMMPRLLMDSEALRSVFELASCGVMRLRGKPGDPQDADSVLVRCGLVQLGDTTAIISNRRGGDPSMLSSREFYLFLNREPMIQYALSEVIFSSTNEKDHFATLEDHIWNEHIEYGDSSRNGVETLGWLLLRAMSVDNALHNLLTGAGSDPEMGEYVNETEFVWCDVPAGSLHNKAEPWIEQYEQRDEHPFAKYLKDKYGVSDGNLAGCVEDLWFHVAHLDHSDTTRAYFLPRVAVMPPEQIGADIVASWRHASDPHKQPLLVLVACTERTDEKKLRDDASNTIPKNVGSRINVETGELKESDYSKLCDLLHDRLALRILLHPNVIPGETMTISELSKAYNLAESVVKAGHGRDDQGNFVVLLNRTMLKRAIHERGNGNSRFVNMVLRLWDRYFKVQEKKKKDDSVPK